MNRKGSTLHMLNANTADPDPGPGLEQGLRRLLGQLLDDRLRRQRSQQHAVQLQLRGRRSGRLLLLLRSDHRPGHRRLPHRDRRGAAVPQVGLRPLSVEGPLRRARPSCSPSRTAIATTTSPSTCIVQDWDYWSPYVWGSHLMDPSRYPDPAALVDQLHAANVHTMISIWPLYQTRNPATPMVTGELDNYNALNAINALYPDTTSGGLYHFYDTFNADGPNARLPADPRSSDRRSTAGTPSGPTTPSRRLSGRRRTSTRRPPRSARARSTSTPTRCEHNRGALRGLAQGRARTTSASTS